MTKTEYKAKASRIRWLQHRANECAMLNLDWSGQRYFSLASEKQRYWPFNLLMAIDPRKLTLAQRLDIYTDDIPF